MISDQITSFLNFLFNQIILITLSCDQILMQPDFCATTAYLYPLIWILPSQKLSIKVDSNTNKIVWVQLLSFFVNLP